MTRRRKKVAERRQDYVDANERVWPTFRPRLEAATNLAEAMALLADAVPEGRPGRAYFSNLGFFLMNRTVPSGSNAQERGLYLQLVRRMRDAGDLLPETCGLSEN